MKHIKAQKWLVLDWTELSGGAAARRPVGCGGGGLKSNNVQFGAKLQWTQLLSLQNNALRIAAAQQSVQDFLNELGMKPCTYVSTSENKHFFTKSCHRHTCQNYRQRPQSLQNVYFQSHFSASKINQPGDQFL